MNGDDAAKTGDWFESWFDSPYYHLLYSNRDHTEAEEFISRLIDFLKPAPGCRMLDLACGKGRHALALHRKGLDVIGIDLSPQSIAEAKKLETDGLTFFVHDMRRPFMINYFDGVFNLFTSFGYFRDKRDNRQVVDAVCKGLKPGGIFVIDFFNASLVRSEIASCGAGEKEAGGIVFHWKKTIINDVINKNIEVADGAKQCRFAEYVQLLSLEDFRTLLQDNFEILEIFGDYNLTAFDIETSKRLIIISRKRP
jgi:SAM-dependent methyltransferase